MKYKNLIIDFIYLKQLDKNYYSLNKTNTSDLLYDSFKITFENKVKKLKPSFLKTLIINYLNKNIGFVNYYSKKIKHYNKMYSLQKVYNIENSLLIKLINNAIKYNFDIIVEPKIDGISVELYNNTLVSRGDGVYGNNISRTLKYLRNIPHINKDEVVYGELYLIKEKGRIDYNHRNIVTGLVNSKHKINNKYTLGFFQFVEHFNNQVNQFTHSKITPDNLKNTLRKIEDNIKNILINKNNYDFYIDGVVIKLVPTTTEILPKIILGYTDKYPKFSIAYKFEAEKTETFLKDVVWDIGKTGKLTVIGILEPVLIQGSKINKVTLHNPEYVINKGIKIGSRVEISRIGDVIPAITKIYPTDNCTDIKIPDKCPVCDHFLNNYLCKNKECKGIISKEWQSKYKLTIKQSYDILNAKLNVFNFKDNISLLEKSGWSKNKIEAILKKLGI